MRSRPSTPGKCQFSTTSFELHIDGEVAEVYLRSGHQLRLWIPSSLGTVEGRDIHLGLTRLKVHQRAAETEIVILGQSSVWAHKEYHWVLNEERLEYFVRVAGTGHLDRLLLLGSVPEVGPGRTLTREEFHEHGRGALGNFTRLFLPQPNAQERHYFSPEDFVRHSVDFDREFYGGNHFFTPAPFCYPLEYRGQWIAITLAARAGEYRFVNFDFWGGKQFSFCVDYEGYWAIRDAWESPHLIIHASSFDDEYQAAQYSCGYLFQHGWIQRPPKDVPAWWREPIFCGWGEQCYLHHLGEFRGRPSRHPAREYASQMNYESFIAHLESKGLNPGTIVIDDCWMLYWGHPFADPGKWRDLRGYIEQQHARGRKVLLWIPTWEYEGVPDEWCIRHQGKPLRADPTHPAYRDQLEKDIRRMLGSGPQDYNADGFKIDFTANIPSGPGCELYEPLWGVELLYRLIELIHKASKRVKPDALIMTHTAHPYFAPVIDMLRLNDIVIRQASVVPEMTHRAKVARAVHPDLLIDTDNWPCPSRQAWLEYVRLQPQLGVPSLYYATHIGRGEATPDVAAEGPFVFVPISFGCGEAIRDEDYALLRQVWDDYRKTLPARKQRG